MTRWITYQRERFPLARHVPLVAVTSVCVLAYAARTSGAAFPDPGRTLGACLTALLFFLLLRILDEFKDAAEDAAHRPYRPVPCGLVTLRELGALGLLAAAAQLALAALFAPATLPWLLGAWAYLALMTREFFAPAWLHARPAAYMLSHLVIVALFQLNVAAWGGAALPASALVWLVAASLGGGALIEVGRKLRAPEQEEPGVQTYTAAWGRRTALAVWIGCAAFSLVGVLGAVSLSLIPTALGVSLLLGLGLIARRFVRSPTVRHARPLETLSGLWVLGVYLALGFWRQP